MNARTCLAGLAAWIAAAGCDPAPSQLAPTAPTGLAELGSITVDPPLDPDEGNLYGRWVLRQSAAGACPAPDAPPSTGSWVGRHLFEEPGVPWTDLPPRLQHYCVYELIPAPGTTGEFSPFDAGPQGTEGLWPDRAAIAASAAPTLKDVVEANAEALFLQQAGEPQSVRPTTVPHVRLAVVDSTPTFEPSMLPWTRAGVSEHGYAMTNIARRLTCQGAGCFADISTQLALDLNYVGTGAGPGAQAVRDSVNGGEFGSISGLAQAIRREVVAWGKEAYSGGGTPLILNLSLGWHPAYGGRAGGFDTWSPDVQAVWDVLWDARCRGALPIVAVGNATNGPTHTTGPILPAMWGRKTLDHTECVHRTGVTWIENTWVDGQNLLYPAGGVDELDQNLPVSRILSRPPHVAYADHAVVTDAFGLPTDVMTGTSVAAVVVASAAAAVWHENPSYRAGQVMQKLLDAGKSVGPAARPWCPTGCDAKKVEVCETIHHICTTGTCTDLAATTCPSTAPPIRFAPAPADAAAFSADSDELSLAFPYGHHRRLACQRGRVALEYADASGLAPDPCPDAQYYSAVAKPFTSPQPHWPQCPYCFLDVGGTTLYLDFGTSFSNYTAMTLTLVKRTGSTSYTTTAMPSGTRVTYSVPYNMVRTTTTAFLTVYDGSDSNTSALKVYP